jgi:hypothetical protein
MSVSAGQAQFLPPEGHPMAGTSRLKLDIPFQSDEEIAVLVEMFEECRWPYVLWTHRAHLAVAVHYLRRLPFPDAVDRARQHIRLYNQTCGDGDGYHETITVLFMRLVAAHLEDHCSSEANLVDELCPNHGVQWLLRYYSPERLWSAEAKARWVEPDLQRLDF